jgi:hypothetical protein
VLEQDREYVKMCKNEHKQTLQCYASLLSKPIYATWRGVRRTILQTKKHTLTQGPRLSQVLGKLVSYPNSEERMEKIQKKMAGARQRQHILTKKPET